MCYCMVDRSERRSTLPFAFMAVVAAVIVALSLHNRALADSAHPPWVVNATGPGARTVTVGGVRWVVSPAAPATLLPDTSAPREPVRLLWLSGRTAQPTTSGSVVLDEAGGILEVDARLRVRRRNPDLEGREVGSVAAAPHGGLWLTTLNGDVIRVDAANHIAAIADRHALGHTRVASTETGASAWLVRTTAHFDYHLDSTAPLLARLDDEARVVPTGRVRIPEHSLLIDLANAGSVAVRDDMVYYTPFIRDEVVAMRKTGDTLWIASRDLPQSSPEPRFELDQGRPVVNYHPVNLGSALGPDGNLYVLSTPGFTTTESRLDVFDPDSGVLLRTAHLATALPTLAVSRTGRVHVIDSERLLGAVSARTLERLRPISLPLLSGGSASIHDPGRVTLVNVWASWCAPCRLEMPALDSLQRELRPEGRFRFITVNEDVRADNAREFMTELAVDFPVLLGKGRMKSQLHYPGLPYTLLVDAEGRVVQKWIGYAGPDQMKSIRQAITAALNGTPSARPHVHH
jgi:thiol-disulfide isomerase/thioredoxin